MGESTRRKTIRKSSHQSQRHHAFKKKLYWQSTFGQITIIESRFTKHGTTIRPFSYSAQVTCRGYSIPLQRVVTDFGADVSFVDAAKKVKEYYGLDLPSSSIRIIVEGHAGAMRRNLKKISTKRLYRRDPEYIVAELDGGMVPVVTINRRVKGDKRKTRKTEWREARLSLAHASGEINPIYKATLGSVDQAGKQLSQAVNLAGRGKKTRIHALGDGAPWIANQVDQIFGSYGKYTIDFFHLSQYLAAAAECIAPNEKNIWRKKQEALMKANRANQVLKTLEDHKEKQCSNKDCGAHKCHQYMEKRMHLFDYQTAIEKDLPIGSGEVESGHRSVIQKHMKLPGAWWDEKIAEDMIAMRTVRANGDWSNYWNARRSTEMRAN